MQKNHLANPQSHETQSVLLILWFKVSKFGDWFIIQQRLFDTEGKLLPREY
jgi:hypothetical protein